MINIKDTEEFKFSESALFSGLPHIKNENYFAAKPYVKIIKELTNESGQYGGNSDSVFVNQRWISTGCGLYGSEITDGIMNLDVFGGDTYINILSINKFHYPQYNDGSTKRNGQGVVFPVESTVNVDMRQGSFFGTNNSHLQIQDEYKLTPAYNAQNSIKSFPAKDPKIKSVQNLKNVIAASNIKINGTRSDAFSAFDANENFELNGNYGSINNLKVFRDSMYAFQQKAISVVSINTRALIQSEQGSNIAIQSAVGTGTVIERNDYISTKFGSQHRMNGYVTDLGMYWVDVNNSTICSVSIKNPNYVFDLLEQRPNAKPMSFADFKRMVKAGMKFGGRVKMEKGGDLKEGIMLVAEETGGKPDFGSKEYYEKEVADEIADLQEKIDKDQMYTLYKEAVEKMGEHFSNKFELGEFYDCLLYTS